VAREVQDDIADQEGFFRDGTEIIGVSLPSVIATTTITPDVVTTPGSLRLDLNDHVPAQSLTLASGMVLTSARVATAAALPTCTYANGSLGVGATLTGDAFGALAAVDGITLSAGDRLVVKTQAADLQHGLYEVTTLGDGSTYFVLTRCVESDTAADLLYGQTVFITDGDSFAGSTVTIAPGTYTIGTTGILIDGTRRVNTTPTDVMFGPSRLGRRYSCDFDAMPVAAVTVTATPVQDRFYVILSGTAAQSTNEYNDGSLGDGVIGIETGTDTNGVADLMCGHTSASFNQDRPLSIYWRGRIPTLTTGGETFAVRIGAMTALDTSASSNALSTAGIFFEALPDGGNWDAITRIPQSAQSGQAWTRSTATITLTVTAHGLAVNDVVFISVTSSAGALPALVAYEVLTVPDANTFTILGLNGGSASGTATVLRSLTTRTDTGLAPSTGMRSLHYYYNPITGAVTFKIGTATVATHTTNLPASSALYPGYVQIAKYTGSNSRKVHTDLLTITAQDGRTLPQTIR
jgi:hypothetical protein